ncbi:MAG: hypothetical protein ABSA44_04945 [Bacteroidota bacterium]|jgi:hypothetical protein
MNVDKSSFINFIYPFLFDSTTFDQRVSQIEEAHWTREEKSLKIWSKECLSEEDVLPHVARYLNPPLNSTPPTAILWKMEDSALGSYTGLGAKAEWKLVTPQGKISFKMNNVHLALFHVGVGFITTEVGSETEDFDAWLDILHYFRFVKGQRKIKIEALRRISKNEIIPYFPNPVGETVKPHNSDEIFQDLLNAILNTALIKEDLAQWWREVFVTGQLLPFASFCVNKAPNEEIATMLFRVRNFYHSRQEIHPYEDELRSDHPSLLPYAKDQWFTFSLDGGAFVAFNPPQTQFFHETIRTHLTRQYFLLFLLALEQRFELMSLSGMVSDNWLGRDEEVRVKTFEHIRNMLLEFTARGYSAQIMQGEHHHRCYQMLQRVFQVERLYQEVKDEVREMHETLMMHRTKKLQQMAEEQKNRTEHFEKFINRVAFLIGSPMLAMAYLTVVSVMGWHTPAYWLIGSAVIGALFLWILKLFR